VRPVPPGASFFGGRFVFVAALCFTAASVTAIWRYALQPQDKSCIACPVKSSWSWLVFRCHRAARGQNRALHLVAHCGAVYLLPCTVTLLSGRQVLASRLCGHCLLCRILLEECRSLPIVPYPAGRMQPHRVCLRLVRREFLLEKEKGNLKLIHLKTNAAVP
jgi:hypothetical protein